MGDYEVGGNRKGEKEVGRLCVRGVLQASVRTCAWTMPPGFGVTETPFHFPNQTFNWATAVLSSISMVNKHVFEQWRRKCYAKELNLCQSLTNER